MMNATSNDQWPAVSIIIINFNGKKYLERCLKSVLEHDYPNFEIILVDNASTDGSIELVKDLFSNDSRLTIIENSKNLGAAQGRNEGVRVARGKYVVFLDNDTEVTSRWLDELVEVMENDSTIGIAQSMLLKMDDYSSIQHGGLFIIDYCGWTWKFCKDETYDHFVKFHKKTVTVSSAVSAAMIVRRQMLKEIGTFDPKFFIYFEDVDLSWRAWLRGYKVVLVPKSIVYHGGGGSIEVGAKASMLREYDYYKNCIRLLIKNYSLERIFAFLPISFACMFAKALIHLMRGDIGSIIGLSRAFFWNVKELSDTMHMRLRVQSIRKVSDKFITKNAMKRLSFTEVINRI